MGLTKADKTQWVAALRSGAFKQGRERLYSPEDETFCCLGVLGAQLGLLPKAGDANSDCFLSPNILPYTLQHDLARMNDKARASFPEIAQWIEDNTQTEEAP